MPTASQKGATAYVPNQRKRWTKTHTYIFSGMVFALLISIIFSDHHHCASYRKYLCEEFDGVVIKKQLDNRGNEISVKTLSDEVKRFRSQTMLWQLVEEGDSISKMKGEPNCQIKSHGAWMTVLFASSRPEDATHCAAIPKYCTCEAQ